MAGGRGDDDRGDDAGGNGSHDIVAVNLAPLVAPGRLTKVIGLIVVNALATVPVIVVHVIALLPVVVADVLLIVGVVMFVLLREHGDRGAADSKKDGRCYGFLEQGRFLQSGWTEPKWLLLYGLHPLPRLFCAKS